MKNDYSIIQYKIDAKGGLWSGPHCPFSTLHWAPESDNGEFDVMRQSDADREWVEVRPQQAVRIRLQRAQLSGITG